MRWWMLGWLVGCAAEVDPTGTEVREDPLDTAGVASDWPEAWTAFEDEVLRLVNVSRSVTQVCGGQGAGAGRALTLNLELRDAARVHSQNMAAENNMSHELFGEGPDARAVEAGYPTSNVSENIAVGQGTPKAVMDAWMRSPGHCRNIMGSSHVALGVGLYVDDSGTPWWTQVFGPVP